MPTATVTIMFTDLVGSTALMSRVGEVEADALRREHFEVLRGPIGARGGTEVKNLGDGLMVAFASAADAVAAAVEVQRVLWRRNEAADEVLEIRVGLAVGDVEVEDGDHFGAPVVQAARLCAVAGTGEVLCTELVRMMAGTRTSAEFEPVGALELKGLDEPVPTARVRWPVPDASSEGPAERSLPGRLAMAVAADFVGRSAEFEVLASAWKAVDAGERRVVLLAGEPGIGKTTLSARLAASVHADGGLVSYGRSDEDLGIPYQPWIESLTHLVGQLPAEVVEAHVADRGMHLARLVPELRRVAGGGSDSSGEGEGEQYVLFGCVVDLLERASAHEPVLVVLDDLHWADRQSLQLLRHVVGCGRPLRVLIVGTFRDSEVRSGDPLSELLAALHREQGTERVAVRGLNDADLRDLLEQLAGHDLDEAGIALRDAVLAETAGNPFFVREILRHLVESGALFQDASGRWVGSVEVGAVGLPVSVTEVIDRRVAALGDESVRLLSVAAVIGRDFDVRLLAAAAGVDEDEVVDRCDAAVDAAVLTATDQLDRYSFAHALIERTLYEGLSRARRARAHRAVAEALEQLVGDDASARAAELAHHWAEAVQPEDTSRALQYAQLAGDRALAQVAPDDAARWYARALELLGDGDPHRRAQLLVGLGEAQRQLGDSAFRSTLAEAAGIADRTGDMALLATAAIASCRGWGSNVGLVDGELVGLLHRALDGIDPADLVVRARLLAELAVEQMYGEDLEHCWDLSVEAIDLARASGDGRTLAQVLQRHTVVFRDPRRFAERLERVEESLSLLEGLDDPMLEWDIVDQARLTVLEGADHEKLVRYSQRSAAAAARVPRADVLWVDAFHEFWVQILVGDLTRAEQTAERAMAFGLEVGQPDAFTIYGAQVVCLRYHRGGLGELIELVREIARDRPTMEVYGAIVTFAHGLEGDVDEAVRGLDRARELGWAVRPDDSMTTALSCWADAACRTGHPGVGELAALLRPMADLLVTTHVTVQPAVAYFVGRLEHAMGELDAAEASFALADEIHRRMESPLLVLYSDVGRAALLADRAGPGEREEARTLAEGVLAASEVNGYGYLAADARAVLEQLEGAS